MSNRRSKSANPLALPTGRLAWLAILFLAGTVGYEAWYMAPSLMRAWYFSSDEYVLVAEVIRFLHLDFRQHFFDMPGTPLMFLTVILWLPVYATEAVFRLVPAGTGLERFTFDHLQLLFTLMRAETLFFALASVVLVFLVASRLMNRAGACIAAFVMMMSPIYTSYSSFIRVESLAMCCILLAVLCLFRGLKYPATRTSSEVHWILLAGILAGLGAATRFHSITASLPLLLLLLFFDRKPLPLYPRWLSRAWTYTLALSFLGACAGAILIKTGYLPNSVRGRILTTIWGNAFGTLYSLALLGAIACAVLLMIHRIPRMQWLARRVQHPRMLVLAAGVCAGCLAGTPTILREPGYFFQSINSYSTTYFDLDRMNWPLLQNVTWYLKFYLRLIAPDYLTMTLLAVGATVILIKRDRLLMPFLLAGLLFFVSKPIKMVAAPHHIIMWLPFYGIIAGYAAVQVFDAIPARLPHRDVLKGAAWATLFVALGLVTVRGPQQAAQATKSTERRLGNVGLATEWIHQNTEPPAVVEVSYWCFNSDTFFTWLRSLEVPVPAEVSDGRQYRIWWGDHSALQGQRGYACASSQDLISIKHAVDQRQPGEGSDPFADKGFQLVKTFGTAPDDINVFSFNFAAPETRP